MEVCFDLADEAKTAVLARDLASCLTTPLILSFQGDLGTGKTTLIRAMLRALGVTGAIKSPTFSYVESYTFSDYVIHHFDLYRLSDESTLDAFGFRDYFSPDAICCIEWPERAPSLKPYIDVLFSLEVCGAGRTLSVTALSVAGETLLGDLRRKLK
ncbi:MAG: tRNA (adenosine(37)-N6)-threonylcarbamoyltransferase complex ATPase subunit type 1 TsaE [Gammaproteobacteria bacterium]|nr:tRNA (adenosine(37)-N6)-threonylcarbamoyltransferase complex ATPase subunit type 1 TsaE [Gammaproteobacteria bacterium]